MDIQKILVVDDHPAFLEGLFMLINANYPYVSIYKALSCRQAKEIIEGNLDLDCIFVDYHLPDQDGLKFLLELQKVKNTTPVVLITADNDIALAHQALNLGAMGFLLKSSDSAMYHQCIETICNGDIYLEPTMQTNLAHFRATVLKQVDAVNKQLTSRQKDILIMLEKGFQNKDISDMLGVSIRTVKSDISILLEVFDVENRSECVAEARQLGVI